MIREADFILNKQTRLRRLDDRMIANVSFLQEIADWMAKNGYEIHTISAAWQLWRAINNVTSGATDKQQYNADIAFWYGVNPESLSEVEKLGYLANLERQIARRKITDGKYNSADHKQVYALYKLAYGDEELAQKAATEAAKQLVDQRTKK